MDNEAERTRLELRSDALKWILVTCFGYQGYRNSKFGRIEAHEVINAYARDILLTAKHEFEDAGWRIVHGIVDSIWVEQVEGDATPIQELVEEITATVDIWLEYEHAFDWICFVPRRESRAGALTKYFGRIRGEDGYKVRGIVIRQRSTPGFIEDAQEAMMDTLARHRNREAVVDCCQRLIAHLRGGAVDPAALIIDKRVSKPLEAYSQQTHTVAALKRYRKQGLEKPQGQHVRYVVVDDGARRTSERVRLPFEEGREYDADQLVRACESIGSPLGWTRTEIRRYLRDRTDAGVTAFE